MSHLGELLSAHLDGELAPAERRRVAEHLEDCDRCREELDELASARSAVRSLPMVEAPASVLGLPDEVVVPLPRRRSFWAGAAAAAAAVFIVVASILAPDGTALTPQDLSDPFGARVSLDPGFTPTKVAQVRVATGDFAE